MYGIGEQSPFKLSDSISNMISDACTPQIEPAISIQTLEDETILVIDVVLGKFRPYYLASKGKETSTYIRINGTSRLPTQENCRSWNCKGKIYPTIHFRRLDVNMMKEKLWICAKR